MLVEARARDVALLSERPEAFQALLEIRRGLADRARLHQRMAGRTRLAGPFARRLRRGRGRRDRWLTGLRNGALGGRHRRTLRKREPGCAEHERARESQEANRMGIRSFA